MTRPPRQLRSRDVGGWVDHGGILVVPIDRMVLVALGHHDPAAVLAALEHLAVQYLHWSDITEGFVTRRAATAALRKRWGVFTGHNRIDWILDYRFTEPTSGAVAVTVLNCSPNPPEVPHA